MMNLLCPASADAPNDEMSDLTCMERLYTSVVVPLTRDEKKNELERTKILVLSPSW